jgi:hypothetical protein
MPPVRAFGGIIRKGTAEPPDTCADAVSVANRRNDSAGVMRRVEGNRMKVFLIEYRQAGLRTFGNDTATYSQNLNIG